MSESSMPLYRWQSGGRVCGCFEGARRAADKCTKDSRLRDNTDSCGVHSK